MKRISIILVLVVCVACFATLSSATTVTLKYTGGYSGVGSAPVPSNIAIGPYSFTLNGTNTWLVCGSSKNDIYNNESWKATVYDINNITTNTVWPPNPVKPDQNSWNEAAWFALQLFKHPGNSQWQNDIWTALGLDNYSNPNFTIDLGLYNAATNNGTILITNARFYIPIPGTQPNGYGVPQPFIGTPEPSSLVLLGFGLIGALRLRSRFS